MTDERIERIIEEVEANQTLEGLPPFSDEEKEGLRRTLQSADPAQTFEKRIREYLEDIRDGKPPRSLC